MIIKYHKYNGYGTLAYMLNALQGKYKWSGMHKENEKYVTKCLICKKDEYELINIKNKVIHSYRRNELRHLNFVDRLKPGKGGNKFILIIVDYCTKFV